MLTQTTELAIQALTVLALIEGDAGPVPPSPAGPLPARLSPTAPSPAGHAPPPSSPVNPAPAPATATMPPPPPPPLGRSPVEPARPIPPRQLADWIGCSPTYLSKIMGLLARGGVVRPVRGSRGGVTLARPPREITLLQIVEACQGLLVGNYCRALSEPSRPILDFSRSANPSARATLDPSRATTTPILSPSDPLPTTLSDVPRPTVDHPRAPSDPSRAPGSALPAPDDPDAPVCGFHRAMADVHRAMADALRRWTLADLAARPAPTGELAGNDLCRMRLRAPVRPLLPAPPPLPRPPV